MVWRHWRHRVQDWLRPLRQESLRWMDSPGHRANILNGAFKSMGVGYTVSEGLAFITQLFIG